MGKNLYYDSDSLKQIAQHCDTAAEKFSNTVSTFKDNSGSGFGVILQMIVGNYDAARQLTVQYGENIADIFHSLGDKVTKAESTMSKLEQQNIDTINKLKERIDDVNDKFTTHHTGGVSDGNGGGSTSIQNNYTPSFNVQNGSTAQGGSSVQSGGISGVSGGVTGSSGGGFISAGQFDNSASAGGNIQAGHIVQDDDILPGDVDYTGSHADDSGNDGTNSKQPGTSGTTIPPVPPAPKPNAGSDTSDDSGNRIDIDSDGDNEADYSITMKDGIDLNAEATRQNGQTSLNITPDRSGKSQWGNVTEGDKAGDFNIDTDGDGKADSTLHVDEGQKSQLSFGEDENGRYVSVDFDHDGDADFSYRVEDGFSHDASEADGGESDDAAQVQGTQNNANGSLHTQPAYQNETRLDDFQLGDDNFGEDDQALDDAWEEIAKNDPLGRSAEELRKQFEERDIVSWDDIDDESGDLTGGFTGVHGISTMPPLMTTQPVTPKGGESWIR